MNKRKSLFYLLITITLFLFVFCLVGCNETDFYEQYGEPQRITPATEDDAALRGDGIGATDDPIGEIDSTPNDGEMTPNDGDSIPITDDEQPPSDGSGLNGGEGITDEETDGKGDGLEVGPQGEEPTDGDGTTVTEPEGEGSDPSDLLPEVFDLSVEKSGLFRYISFAPAEDLPVYVGMRQVGTASLTATGTIVFSCDFEIAERELWGTWDEAYRLSVFVRFDELPDPFRQMKYRPSVAMSLQLDLSEAELSLLEVAPIGSSEGDGSVDEEEKAQDPVLPPEDPQTGDEQETPENPQVDDEQQYPEDPQVDDEQQDPQDPQVGDEQQDPEDPQVGEDPQGEESACLPQESGARHLFDGIGTVREVEVITMSAEEEEYAFLLVGAGEELDELMDVFAEYIIYSDKSDASEQYQATAVLGQKVFNLFIQITRNDPAFTAAVKVLGAAL